MNTDFFTKPVGKVTTRIGTSNPIATTAWRGVSAGLIAWMYFTFGTKTDLENVRSWVRSLSQSRTAQVDTMDHRLDALERSVAFVQGRLGLPMSDPPQRTTNTNAP